VAGETGAIAPFLNCRLSEDVLLVEHFLPKIQNLWSEIPIRGKFDGKNKILSIHNLLCRKCAACCLSENSNFLRRLLSSITNKI